MSGGYRAGFAAIVAVIAMGASGVARAEHFDVPPGRVGEVAAALGAQAGITITVPEPDLADRHSPGVSGDISLREALIRALRGTGTEAVFYDPTLVRIVRQSAAAEPASPPAAPPPAAEAPIEEVVVTASKQNMRLEDYPGSVKLVKLDPGWIADKAAAGTEAITSLLPALGSTHLGPGRDKLFIRGIADSSFNGPTQATVAQYLGDIRLNYNAPDPDLNLYDMQRVEVLVGPQGTLYGAGSLGGVIRLVPNAPNTVEASASASEGVSTTEFGGIGSDGALMYNQPLIEDHLAVRLVAFGARRAGYIDDPSRGLQDINSTTSYGGRAAVRIERLSGWTVDGGYIVQEMDSADGQYTLRTDPPLNRDSTIPQPFHNEYRLSYISARRKIDDMELVSTTSSVWQNERTVFDATGHDGTTVPARYEEDNDITLISHETRLSGGDRRSPWVGGLTTLFSSSALSRSLGPLNAPAQIAGVVNVQAEAALFGQLSYPFSHTLTGTIGERMTFANSTGLLIQDALAGSPKSSRDDVFFSNTLALDWHPAPPFSVFFHYQQGYRPGGLAVAPSGSGLESRRFDADGLNMDELGLRLGDAAHDRLSIHSAIFFADWKNIQADLVDTSGLPYTANIGDGGIYGFDGEIVWHPLQGFTASASAFVDDSRLLSPKPEFSTSGHRTLPNVARDGGRLAADWLRDVAPGMALDSYAAVRYVGKSILGVGQFLDISQGGYCVADIGTRLAFSGFAFSLNVDNVADARANTFAFGNPFGVGNRDQITPLRPRTLRLGLDASF